MLLWEGTSIFSRPGVTPASLLKFTTLHPQVQSHLSRVYLTLCCSLAVSALGCYVGLLYGGVLPLTQLVAFGCLLGLMMTPDNKHNLRKRYGMLAGFAFTQGCSLTPLIAMANVFHPGLVLTAMLATGAVFLCFSLSALLTPRRTYLFLGGYLTSALLAMTVMHLGMSLFGGGAGASGWGLDLQVALGILVFSGYVLFDTQVIIEQAYAGDMDHVRHACNLLGDVIALFVRVLVLLMRQAEKKEEEERRRRKARRD